jgi:hypothetical protein
MVLSARAAARHHGYVALQPIVELIELIAARFSKPSARTYRDQERKSRSSLPPCG